MTRFVDKIIGNSGMRGTLEAPRITSRRVDFDGFETIAQRLSQRFEAFRWAHEVVGKSKP
jgi:hypothetical protein